MTKSGALFDLVEDFTDIEADNALADQNHAAEQKNNHSHTCPTGLSATEEEFDDFPRGEDQAAHRDAETEKDNGFEQAGRLQETPSTASLINAYRLYELSPEYR